MHSRVYYWLCQLVGPEMHREAVVSAAGGEPDVAVSWRSRQLERTTSSEVGETEDNLESCLSFTSVALGMWLTEVADTRSGLRLKEAEE